MKKHGYAVHDYILSIKSKSFLDTYQIEIL